MEQDKVSKLSDVGKNVWAEDGNERKKVEQEKKVSYRQRWDKARATKFVSSSLTRIHRKRRSSLN
jgi:hypothetical protein